jgi:glutamine amidotransferase PdxT
VTPTNAAESTTLSHPPPDPTSRDPNVLLGGMRVSMARNSYGRQLTSFECTDLVLDTMMQRLGSGGTTTGVGIFIRAAAIVDVADGVHILATLPSPEQHRRRSADSTVAGAAAAAASVLHSM